MAARTLKAQKSACPLRDYYNFRYERSPFIDAQALAGPSRRPSNHGSHQAQIRHQCSPGNASQSSHRTCRRPRGQHHAEGGPGLLRPH